jgi:hypothetical protein
MPAPSIRSLSFGLFVFFLILTLFVGCAHPLTSTNPATASPNPAARTHLVESYSKLPFSFEVNQGQTDPEVKFLARGPGYGLFLKPTKPAMSTYIKSQHCLKLYLSVSLYVLIMTIVCFAKRNFIDVELFVVFLKNYRELNTIFFVI